MMLRATAEASDAAEAGGSCAIAGAGGLLPPEKKGHGDGHPATPNLPHRSHCDHRDAAVTM